jgi:hypothetical protein
MAPTVKVRAGAAQVTTSFLLPSSHSAGWLMMLSMRK